MSLQAQVEQALECRVRSMQSISGGDAACAWVCETESHERFFVKTVSTGSPFRMEALGLQRLKVPNGVRVPEVIKATDTLLILEYVSFGSPGPEFQEKLGHHVAMTHQQCREDFYGFDEDHFIGKTPQKNTPTLPAEPLAWQTFWWTHRLEPMFQRLSDPDIRQLGHRLEGRLSGWIGPVKESPSLIHGDLWSGNVAADASGNPVMFDPAPSYSHREAELGMTKLFGGFTPSFMSAYQETFPLAEGWKERQDLYMLYHVLNHAVLFGPSYLSQAKNLCERYV